MDNRIAAVTAEFHKADAIWQAELEAAFGDNAVNARYTPLGHGEPGTPLREAYKARVVAQDAFNAAWREANRVRS